jgi:hypothetical protein
VSTKSRQHAERLRQFTEQSNAVHKQYLSDPDLLSNYEVFLDWQVAYSLPFYSEFEESPATAAAVKFVSTDLVGTGVSARDAELKRILPIMIRLLPASALQTLASAMELNARVLTINLAICRQLFTTIDPQTGISERDYCAAFRRTVSLDECWELIDLTINLGHSLKRMVRSPLLGATLRAMHHPAHVAGFGAMQDFLEQGYATFHDIEDVDYFLDRFAARMKEVFARTCEGPLEEMDASPIAPLSH